MYEFAHAARLKVSAQVWHGQMQYGDIHGYEQGGQHEYGESEPLAPSSPRRGHLVHQNSFLLGHGQQASLKIDRSGGSFIFGQNVTGGNVRKARLTLYQKPVANRVLPCSLLS